MPFPLTPLSSNAILRTTNHAIIKENVMLRFGTLLLLSSVAALATFCPVALHAQQYIFTNDNVYAGNNNMPNSATALSVSSKGVAKVIATYSTGAVSSGGGDFAQTQVASADTSAASCLFASNGGNSTIAAFTIDLKTGHLTTVKGSPFPSGGSGDQQYGIGLTTGNGHLLFAANTADRSISVIKIKPDCSLQGVTNYSVSGTPDGMRVTPNGKFLLVALLGTVDSFQINYKNGTMKDLGAINSHGDAAGVDISCDSSTAYFGDAGTITQVEVFTIGSNGRLTEINNFTNSNGDNSNNVLLSADGKTLYVSNTMSDQITTLAVGSGGSLTYESSTQLAGTVLYALGLALGKNGKDLFVAEENSPETIGVLVPDGDAVKEVPGSPFTVINNGGDPPSLTAVPPKSCK
jgi:6-phosphogluconolactonase (cycloisomerase 2 family)